MCFIWKSCSTMARQLPTLENSFGHWSEGSPRRLFAACSIHCGTSITGMSPTKKSRISISISSQTDMSCISPRGQTYICGYQTILGRHVLANFKFKCDHGLLPRTAKSKLLKVAKGLIPDAIVEQTGRLGRKFCSNARLL